MKKLGTLGLLTLLVALGALARPAASLAAKLEKINVQPTADGIQVKLTGTDRLSYKVQDFKSPPRILIQLYDTEKGIPYEKLAVDQSPVTNLKIMQVTKKGAPATFVNVHLSKAAQYDFDVSPDGRDFVLKVFNQGKAGSTPPTLVDANAYQDDWAAPAITTPSGSKEKSATRTTLPEFPSEEDNTPFVEGPIKIVDADASQVIQVLTKAFNASIVLDKEILTQEATAKAAGTPTGITLSLSNITLQDALDVVASANGWKWDRVGDTYIMLHELTDEYGYDMTPIPRFNDPAQQMDVMVFKPKFMDACQFSTYASTIIPLPTKYFHCDPSKNIAILRGTKKDLDRAAKLFTELDTKETRDRPSAAESSRTYEDTQNFVSRVVRLKYIRAEDLYNKMTPLIAVDGSPYLGNLRLVQSFGVGILQQSGAPVENYLDNTLAFDPTTNTLVFVGREKIYLRLMEIIEMLDAPYSATVVRMVPLKYVQVADLKSDIATEGVESSFFNNIRKMFGRGSNIFVSEDMNSITFVGTEDDYDRLIQLVNTVDVESREFIYEAVPMKNMRVEALASTSDKLLSPIIAMISKQELNPDNPAASKVKLSYSPANNTVIVGAQRQYMEKIKKFLKDIDLEPQDVVTKEFVLKYVKAERVLQVLKSIAAKDKEVGHIPEDGGFFTKPETWDVDYISYQMQSLWKEGAAFNDLNRIVLHAENTRNTIIASGSNADMKVIEQIIGFLDRVYPQIRIQVQLIELRNTKDKNIGMGYVYQNKGFTGNFNFDDYPHPTEEKFSVSDGHLIPVVTDYTTAQDGSPKPEWGLADAAHQITGNSGFFLYDTAENFLKQFAPTLKALITEEVGRFIAEPSVIVAENMKTEFAFTDQIPYITSDVDPATGRLEVIVKFKEIGFTMDLKAHFTPDGFIILNMDPIVFTTLQGFKAFEYMGGTNEVPVMAERKAQTEVKLQDGQPFIIGGFIHSVDSKTIARVPFLSDLPLFGKLFKKKLTKNEENEIVLVVTPTIIPVCHDSKQTDCI